MALPLLVYVPTYPRRNYALFIRGSTAPTQSGFYKKPAQISKNYLGCFHHPTLLDIFKVLGPDYTGSLPSIYLRGFHTGTGNRGEYDELMRDWHALNCWFGLFSNGQQGCEKTLSVTDHQRNYKSKPGRAASSCLLGLQLSKSQKIANSSKGAEKKEPCPLFVGN